MKAMHLLIRESLVVILLLRLRLYSMPLFYLTFFFFNLKIYSDNNVGESPLSSQGCSQLIRVISESQVCPINALMRMRLLVRFIFSLSTVFL